MGVRVILGISRSSYDSARGRCHKFVNEILTSKDRTSNKRKKYEKAKQIIRDQNSLDPLEVVQIIDGKG